MSTEARAQFLAFACSADALWLANFRDFNGALLRMAALAPGGRITRQVVDQEIRRLRSGWRAATGASEAATDLASEILPPERLATIDRFERVQLADVIRVCRASRTLSEAGRTLFAASRNRRSAPNDADRLRKYLLRFGLDWTAVRRHTPAPPV